MISRSLFVAGLLAASACSANPQPTGAATEPQAAASTATGMPFVETMIADFEHPWAMTFLPDGRMLVTEKSGPLLLVAADGKSRVQIASLPVDAEGQGGLMDVVLAPDFAQSKRVYLSWSAAGAGGKGVVLARGVLDDTTAGAEMLRQIEVLFRAAPFVSGNGHYSGRIAFSPDGRYLFFANGERQKFDPAQDPRATLGKMLRLTLDGKPAPDNPLTAQGFHPAVWSYGHRNVLGVAFDAAGNLWAQEMGPKGGDELNLVLPGRNYGYPKVSNGVHYDGKPIPDHAPGDGFEAPKVWWTPVISPAGLMIYSGDLFPQWKGDAFIGGLSSKALVRVDLNGTNAQKGDQWDMGARIREVEQAPDGSIYVLEDGAQGSQGRMIRLTPAQ